MELGDYCLFHKWGDCDPSDPWHVGYLAELHEEPIEHYRPKETGRSFAHCKKISRKLGSLIMQVFPILEKHSWTVPKKANEASSDRDDWLTIDFLKSIVED